MLKMCGKHLTFVVAPNVWYEDYARQAVTWRVDALAGATRTLLLVVLVCGLAASACGSSAVREAEARTGGSVTRGQTAIGKYGCAACHTIPGIGNATATVGPPLDRIAVRQYLGGHLTNTPDNIVKWIERFKRVRGEAYPGARLGSGAWASPLHVTDRHHGRPPMPSKHDDPEPQPASNPH